MKESFLTNSNATRKTTRFLVRDRNATPQTPCTEPVWTHQTAKAIGQECEKPQGNQGF
jgi:hypothetical protein